MQQQVLEFHDAFRKTHSRKTFAITHGFRDYRWRAFIEHVSDFLIHTVIELKVSGNEQESEHYLHIVQAFCSDIRRTLRVYFLIPSHSNTIEFPVSYYFQYLKCFCCGFHAILVQMIKYVYVCCIKIQLFMN